MKIIKKMLLAYILGEYTTGAKRLIDEKNLEQLGNHICKQVESKTIAITRGRQLLMYAGITNKGGFSTEQILRFIQNKEFCFAMASLIIENFYPTGSGFLAVKMGQLVRTIEALLSHDVYTSGNE